MTTRIDAAELPSADGYEIEELLGSGGFGRVFRARRAGPGGVVALKVGSSGSAGRFWREGRILAKLSGSVAPRLIDRGTTSDGRPYLALELIDGVSLRQWLEAFRERPELPPEQLVTTFCVVCDAVERLHAAGIVHRDLKPDNILLVGRPAAVPRRVVLLDFGTGRVIGERRREPQTRPGQRLGTPGYMAPELCRGDTTVADRRTDVYALGAILFEALCGRPPFVGADATAVELAHLKDAPPCPSALADVPSCLDDVVADCLAKSPGDRPGGARAVAERVMRALFASESRAERLRRAPTRNGRRTTGQVRTVAMLGVDTAEPAHVVAEAVERDGGTLVFCEGDMRLAVFPVPGSVEESLEAALRGAQRLRRVASRLAVHVAVLRVRDTDDGPRLSGRPVLEPASWFPESWGGVPPGGVALTRDAIPFLRGVTSVRDAGGQAWCEPGASDPDDYPTALRGHPERAA